MRRRIPLSVVARGEPRAFAPLTLARRPVAAAGMIPPFNCRREAVSSTVRAPRASVPRAQKDGRCVRSPPVPAARAPRSPASRLQTVSAGTADLERCAARRGRPRRSPRGRGLAATAGTGPISSHRARLSFRHRDARNPRRQSALHLVRRPSVWMTSVIPGPSRESPPHPDFQPSGSAGHRALMTSRSPCTPRHDSVGPSHHVRSFPAPGSYANLRSGARTERSSGVNLHRTSKPIRRRRPRLCRRQELEFSGARRQLHLARQARRNHRANSRKPSPRTSHARNLPRHGAHPVRNRQL